MKRLESEILRVAEEIEALGHPVHLRQRVDDRPRGIVWPPVELGIFLEVDDCLQWVVHQELVVQLARSVVGDVRRIVGAPMREGRIVSALGGRIGQTDLFPLPDEVAAWEGDLDLPLLHTPATDLFSTAVNALAEASGILQGLAGDREHEHEEETLRTTVAEFQRSYETFRNLISDEPKAEESILIDAAAVLEAFAERVQGELDAINEDQDSPAPFAAALSGLGDGGETEELNTIGSARLHLIEWDVEPSGAVDRMQRAAEALAAATDLDS